LRILGIDPGSLVTGYGVVERRGAELRHVAHGTLRPLRGAPLAARLAAIHAGVVRVIEAHRPAFVVVEQVFIAGNPRTALVLGQARGVALAAAAAAGLRVDELSPQAVKLAVVGTGAAKKLQVQRMVQRLLALEEAPVQDAADALAAALCAGQASPRLALAAAALGASSHPLRGARGPRGGPRAGRFVLSRIR
jgi:crossover junction endodeoxyribonuclease RuvC